MNFLGTEAQEIRPTRPTTSFSFAQVSQTSRQRDVFGLTEPSVSINFLRRVKTYSDEYWRRRRLAFRANEARMPQANDHNYDGVEMGMKTGICTYTPRRHFSACCRDQLPRSLVFCLLGSWSALNFLRIVLPRPAPAPTGFLTRATLAF